MLGVACVIVTTRHTYRCPHATCRAWTLKQACKRSEWRCKEA